MDNSPLRRLPPELHLRIFKEALTFNYVCYDFLGGGKHVKEWGVRPWRPGDKFFGSSAYMYDMDDPFLTEFLGLLLVCKQVRQESAGLVLEANTLHMRITR